MVYKPSMFCRYPITKYDFNRLAATEHSLSECYRMKIDKSPHNSFKECHIYDFFVFIVKQEAYKHMRKCEFDQFSLDTNS